MLFGQVYEIVVGSLLLMLLLFRCRNSLRKQKQSTKVARYLSASTTGLPLCCN